MLSIDFGDSHYQLKILARGLHLRAGKIRSVKEPLEQIRDEVAIPGVKDVFNGNRELRALESATYDMPPRRKYHGGGSPLVVTGRLGRAAVQRSRWIVDGTIGNLFVPANTFQASPAKYGRFQHEGGPNPLGLAPVPARPFYYFDQFDIERAEEIIENWINANLRQAVGLKVDAATVGSVLGRG